MISLLFVIPIKKLFIGIANFSEKIKRNSIINQLIIYCIYKIDLYKFDLRWNI